MIFGLNFNGQPIPPAIQRMFAREQRLYRCQECDKHQIRGREPFQNAQSCDRCQRRTLHHAVRGVRAYLAGVGQSEGERDAMIIQATNGHRELFVVPRQTAAGIWYGIYVF